MDTRLYHAQHPPRTKTCGGWWEEREKRWSNDGSAREPEGRGWWITQAIDRHQCFQTYCQLE